MAGAIALSARLRMLGFDWFTLDTVSRSPDTRKRRHGVSCARGALIAGVAGLVELGMQVLLVACADAPALVAGVGESAVPRALAAQDDGADLG